MDNESAQLSIDFLIGFAIFIIGFIFVATLVSGLLIGLQSKTIDFDAVAYRTSVILVEDPGEPRLNPYASNPNPDDKPWELIQDVSKITRFGLELSQEDPGILSGQKVDKFFNGGFNNSELKDRLLLNESGQYPYHFNIFLSDVSGSPAGDADPPHNAGSIARAVYIKEYQDTFSLNDPVQFANIHINFTELQNPDRGVIYGINQKIEPIEIELINETTHPIDLINVFLTPPENDSYIYEDNIPVLIDGSIASSGHVDNKIDLIFEPDHFSGYSGVNEVVLHFHFQFGSPDDKIDFEYTPPPLKKAVLKVSIW